MSNEEDDVPEAKMSQDQVDALKTWLDEKWTESKACGICGANLWQLQPYLAMAPLFFPERGPLGGPTYLYASLMCNNCGNSVLFNAIHLGLVNQKEIDANKKEGSDVS